MKAKIIIAASLVATASASDFKLEMLAPNNHLLKELAKFRENCGDRVNFTFTPTEEPAPERMIAELANAVQSKGLRFNVIGGEETGSVAGVFDSGTCVGYVDFDKRCGFIWNELRREMDNGAVLRIREDEGVSLSFDNSGYDFNLLENTLNLFDRVLAKNVEIQVRTVRADSEVQLCGILNTLKTNFPDSMDMSVFKPKFAQMFKKYMQDLDQAMSILVARN